MTEITMTEGDKKALIAFFSYVQMGKGLGIASPPPPSTRDMGKLLNLKSNGSMAWRLQRLTSAGMLMNGATLARMMNHLYGENHIVGINRKSFVLTEKGYNTALKLIEGGEE